MNIPLVDLDRVQDSIENARGMPNRYYTDLDAYAEERDALFADQWACAAFASDVPEAGCVYRFSWLACLCWWCETNKTPSVFFIMSAATEV